MAQNATIYKAELQISDMDRGYYASHQLTIAQHPSETLQRMMLRILAFALNATPELAFTKGISTDDEPALWQKSLSDEIELWIDLGTPDERRIRKGSNRAKQVIVYSYGERSAPEWWKTVKAKLSRFNNVTVYYIDDNILEALEQMVRRTMQIQTTMQDGELWLTDGVTDLTIIPQQWDTNS
jgi:uncharacterized protein YaeQ